MYNKYLRREIDISRCDCYIVVTTGFVIFDTWYCSIIKTLGGSQDLLITEEYLLEIKAITRGLKKYVTAYSRQHFSNKDQANIFEYNYSR